MCGEGGLYLGKDPVPRIILSNCLKSFGRKPITYDNASYLMNLVLILKPQVNYVQDIIVTRDTGNICMLRKEVIQVISDIGQSNYFFNKIITCITLFVKIGYQL